MKKIKLSESQVTVYVISKADPIPEGEIWFSDDEWIWIKKLTAGMVIDPESLRSFWRTMIEKKKSVPGYSVFQDFPVFQEGQKVETTGLKICSEIIESLKGRRRG